MPFDAINPQDTALDQDTIEETGVQAAASPDTEEEWDSEFWIVRDRPPYRV